MDDLPQLFVVADRVAGPDEPIPLFDEKDTSLDVATVELSPMTNNLPQPPTITTVTHHFDGRVSISSASSAGDEDADTTSSMTSTPPSECAHDVPVAEVFASTLSTNTVISELYAENIVAKAVRTAQSAVGALPFAFPEIVPQEAGSGGTYSLREADFWTCGFFPGTLYLLLERLVRFPSSVQFKDASIHPRGLRNQLTTMCRTWSEPIRGMDTRTDTHDIGFIVMPSLRLDWELFGNTQSLDSIVCAARSLATRYLPSARAIRSWDLLKKKDIEILDQTDNMIVIIDSMCNLDLLYYASHHARDSSLAGIATAHALTLLQSHLRPESGLKSSKDAYSGQWYSTCHAWGILGYAETYTWTKDLRFLEAACGLTEYFLYRLETAPVCVGAKGRHVPLWDFDAPVKNEDNPLRDSSAGVIAANGMLILSQALVTINQPALSMRYRNAALRIVQDTLEFALAPEKTRLVPNPYQYVGAEEKEPGVRFDGMLKFGTANNNAQARKRYANHSLVYGDYYLVEFGNRLLRMGLH
ncbi:Six-hairpin glycosidase [Lizonia empirigonia]|nr:Six-hairpin glycosidase [Lizonia empirigonia]